MSPSLSILTLLRSSMLGIIYYRKGLLITAVYTVVLTAMVLGSLLYATENGAEYIQSTDPMADALAIDIIWSRLAYVGIFLLGGAVFGAGVFNMWIRFAVLGADDVAFPSKREAVLAAIINFIKIVVIWIAAQVIAVLVLLVFYLVSGLDQNRLIDDLLSATLTCGALAIFADTLIKTALARNVGDIGPPRTMQFAVLLWLLWAADYVLMQFLLMFTNLLWLSVAFIPFDIILSACSAAAFGYMQVWRLRVFIGEDPSVIPVKRSNGA